MFHDFTSRCPLQYFTWNVPTAEALKPDFVRPKGKSHANQITCLNHSTNIGGAAVRCASPRYSPRRARRCRRRRTRRWSSRRCCRRYCRGRRWYCWRDIGRRRSSAFPRVRCARAYTIVSLRAGTSRRAVLPEQGVTYYEVPAEYHVTGYRYTYVNEHPVLVEPRTRRVVQIID